jgi:hypothetical protein
MAETTMFPGFEPLLAVNDAGGLRYGVALSQTASGWRPAEGVVESLSLYSSVSWTLLPAGARTRSAYPLIAANPFEMIGRNVDVVAGGVTISAVVCAFHGALDLQFAGAAVRVRHMLEVVVNAVDEAYYDRVFGRQAAPADAVKAGAVVTSVAPFPGPGQNGGDAPGEATVLVGLVVGRSGNRLIVAPVRPFLSHFGFELAAADSAAQADEPFPEASEERKRAAVLHLRDAFLTIQRRDGFLYDGEPFDDYFEDAPSKAVGAEA